MPFDPNRLKETAKPSFDPSRIGKPKETDRKDIRLGDLPKEAVDQAAKSDKDLLQKVRRINPLTGEYQRMTPEQEAQASKGFFQGLGGAAAGGFITDILNIPSGLYNLGVSLGEKAAPSLLGVPQKDYTGVVPRAPTLPSSMDITTALFKKAKSPYEEKYRELGTILGGFALPLPVTAGVTSLIKGGSKVASTALGRPLKAAEESLVKKVQELGEGRLNELTAQEKATLDNLLAEQRAAETKLTAETQRKAVAEKTAEKAKGAEERAVLGLKGTRTAEEFGEYGIVPMTKQKLGEDIRSLVTDFVTSIKNVRKAKADQEFTTAFASAAEKEGMGKQFVGSKKMNDLRDFLDARLEQTTDPSIANNLKRIRGALFEGRMEGKDLVAPPTFKSAEDIRRLLGDAVSGVTAEGYEAIGQNLARDIYGKLTDAMKDFSPGFEKYLARYKNLSEAIESTGTKLGKAVIGEEKAAPGFYNVTADKLADRVFANPESVRTFTEAIGGNKQPVEALAERYFSNQLAAKSTEDARKFLTSDKTRALLEELGPEFRAKIETRYFTKATQQSKRVEAAQGVVAESDIKIKDLTKQIDGLVDEIQTKTGQFAIDKKYLQDQLEGIRLSISDADRVSRSTKLLSELEGTMPPSEFAKAENFVRQIKDEGKKRTDAIKVVGSLGAGGLATYFGLPRILGGQ